MAKKKGTEAGGEAGAKAPVLDAEAKQQADAGEETASQRAQRIARERVAAKAKASEKLKADKLAEAVKLGAEFGKTLLFLPMADRDGKIVPFLVIGGEESSVKTENGDILLDEKTRETVTEYQLKGYLFTAADAGVRQAIWKRPPNLKEA